MTSDDVPQSDGEKRKIRKKTWTSLIRPQKLLILFSAVVCQFFSAGFSNALGIFYVEFLDSFQASRGVIGWATSIFSGLVFGAGLVVGPVVAKIGPRKSAILGGISAFVGLLSASFAPHIAVVYVTFGALAGCGSCMVCVSAFVSVGQHFQKGRGSATSLSVAGSGLGALLLPIILRPIIDEYGWRGAMMILSAAMLHVLPAAGLLVPPRKKNATAEEQKKPQPRETLCSRSMWTNSSFVCFLIICPIASAGYQYTYVVMVDLGISLGHSKLLSTLLLTYTSLANTLCCLCFGLILRIFPHYSILLFNICLVTMGTVMFVFPYVTSYAALVGLAVGYGAAIGGINGLYCVIPGDLLGLRRNSMGVGLACTVFGIGYLLSAPVAGALNDLTGTYTLSFYVAASVSIVCAVPFAIVRFVQVRRERRDKTRPEKRHEISVIS